MENTRSSTPVETMDEIKQLLDRVVAKFAERLPDEATEIVHDTYLTRFEGVEGMLIEQDAALVEDLEKDFNVTLPLAIKDNLSVDEVRRVVQAMQAKLDHAKSLLVEAEKNRQDVFSEAKIFTTGRGAGRYTRQSASCNPILPGGHDCAIGGAITTARR